MDIDTIFVTASALVALVVVAMTIRPSAAPAVALVLTVLGQALAYLVPWPSRSRVTSSSAGDGWARVVGSSEEALRRQAAERADLEPAIPRLDIASELRHDDLPPRWAR